MASTDSLPGAVHHTNEELEIDNWMRRHEFDEALVKEISGMADTVFDVLQLTPEELRLRTASWSPLARIRFDKELKKLGEELRVVNCSVADVAKITVAAVPLPPSLPISTVVPPTEPAASLEITDGPTSALSCVTRSSEGSMPGAPIYSSPMAAHRCDGVTNAAPDNVHVATDESLVSASGRRASSVPMPTKKNLSPACSRERPLAASINQPQQESGMLPPTRAVQAFPSSSPKPLVQVSNLSEVPSPSLEAPQPVRTLDALVKPVASACAAASVPTSPMASIGSAPVPVAAPAHKRVPLSALPAMERRVANMSMPRTSEWVEPSNATHHAMAPHGAEGVVVAKPIDEFRGQQVPDSMAAALKLNDSKRDDVNQYVSKEKGPSEPQNHVGEPICVSPSDRVTLKRRDDIQSKAMRELPPNGMKRKRQSKVRSSSVSKKAAMKRRQQSISVPFVANPDGLVDALCADGWHQVNLGDKKLYAPPPQHRLRNDVGGLPTTTAYDSLLEVAKVTRPQEIVSARFESSASVWTNGSRAWYQCSACNVWREVTREASSLPRERTCAAYGLNCSAPATEALSRAVTLGDISIFACASCKCHIAIWKDDEPAGAQLQKCKACTRSRSRSLHKNSEHGLSIARAIMKDPAFQDRPIVFQLKNPRSMHGNKRACIAWAKYRNAGTLRQAMSLGAKKTDLVYDIWRKWAWFPGYDIENYNNANENHAPVIDDYNGEYAHESAHDEDDDTPAVNVCLEMKATAVTVKPFVAFGALFFKYGWRAVARM